MTLEEDKQPALWEIVIKRTRKSARKTDKRGAKPTLRTKSSTMT